RICTPHCGIDPESTSGGETYERELLRHLAARGAVLDILLARHQRHPEGVSNWVIHRLPIGRGLRWPVAMALLPPIIRRVHAATRFDLLRVHSLRFIGPAALIARRRYRLDVPIVSHHHHLDPSRLNPLIERRVIEASERVITVSEFSRRQLVAELRVAPERIEVVPNGIDARFAPGAGDRVRGRHGLGTAPVALFLGGLKRRKNLGGLLDAWAEVARARPDALLLVAGSGPLEAALRRRADALGLGGRAIFAGRVAEADKVDYYNAADLFVSPSSLEGFGFTVGEAMSCGRPVVVSDRGALPELVVDGEGGFVCRHGDAAELARRILTLLGDPALRDRFGAFNRERVDRRFRWDRASRRVLEIYEEVCSEWKRGLRAR
ncbi:MAG TPA: glycosyltransferase family 4 protein, partial [Candidatus Methylomirabilis sp.]|nr:glycosyltransferase family 4 protein [Candidatus Methylomirabilis sp.]